MAYVIENLEVELATGLAGPRCSANLSGIYLSLSLLLFASLGSACLWVGFMFSKVLGCIHFPSLRNSPREKRTPISLGWILLA